MVEDLPVVIAMYEKIRHLPKFDPHHIPLIEFQTVAGSHYFLQYHRTRDFEPSSFQLTRDPEPGEVAADFVRGATPPEGIVVSATTYFTTKEHFQLNESETGSWDIHWQHHFIEARSRRLEASFVKTFEKITHNSIDNGHLNRSVLFKPRVSVSVDFDAVLPEEVMEQISKSFRSTDASPQFRVRVVSDGRKAYVKYLRRP